MTQTRLTMGTMNVSSLLTLFAILSTTFPIAAFAVSTGITLSHSSLTTTVSTQVNFQTVVVKDGGPTHSYITVSDNGGGGNFFNSDGGCDNTDPDSDNQFGIQNSKNVCYSNTVPGSYTVAVALFDESGVQIGDPKTLTITVNEVESVVVNPNVMICHATQADKNPYNDITTDAKSIVNLPNGHNEHTDGGLDDVGDIIPPFEYDFDGTGVKTYPGLNWSRIFSNGLTGQQIHDEGGCDGRPAGKAADLAIIKTVSTTTPNVGTNIVYTLTVTNNGGNTAKGIVVTDPLASDLTFVSALPTPDAVSPYTWLLADLASGASTTITVTATVKSDIGETIIANTATVVGSIADPDLSNNSDTVRVSTVVPPFVKEGCTDNDATNYDQSATVDDGTCTYSVTVNKVINGKTEYTPDLFSFTVDGTATTSFNASGTATIVRAPGTYAINEVPATGFVVSSLDCGSVMVVDAPVSCTITNTPEDQVEYGTLVVVKEVVGEDGPNYADFSFTVNGVATTSFSSGNTAALTLVTGTYTVEEVPVEGYSVAYSNCDQISVTANATTTCTITNTVQTGPQCVPDTNVWASTVDEFSQGLKKGNSPVSTGRSDKNLALGEANWTAGGGNGFVSLGFGGVIVLSFPGYFIDTPGDDIFVYEATNGQYPPETALVEVSQDGVVWVTLGTVGQLADSLDLADSGLAWAQYVRLTDTTNPLPHNNDADGFDLDAVKVAEVVCVPPVPEVDTYTIQGYVWHDDNRNQFWDGFENESEDDLFENPLGGWEVSITNGVDTYSTTTDEYGYYYFEVPAGTWTITETVQDGWLRTTQESHVVTVPVVASARHWLLDLILPVAHAAVLGTYGDFNFGNDTEDTTITTTSSGGGGGGGGSATRVRPRVLGVTDTPLPTPLVLGEQVSVVPVGAPDTGRGGAASQQGVTFSLGQLLYTRREEE